MKKVWIWTVFMIMHNLFMYIVNFIEQYSDLKYLFVCFLNTPSTYIL
jgi:hypothetical protein